MDCPRATGIAGESSLSARLWSTKGVVVARQADPGLDAERHGPQPGGEDCEEGKSWVTDSVPRVECPLGQGPTHCKACSAEIGVSNYAGWGLVRRAPAPPVRLSLPRARRQGPAEAQGRLPCHGEDRAPDGGNSRVFLTPRETFEARTHFPEV